MAASSKGRILCTEDDPDSLELMLFVLQNAGYEVVCSSDPKLALKLALSEPFDLLIMDNWMPELSGVDLAKQIREFNQTVPILLYSGAVFDSDKRKAFEVGVQAYLAKPFAIESLVAEVDRLIRESTKP